MSARIQGVLWLLLAGGLTAWATAEATFPKVALAILAFIYGVLQLVRARVVGKHILLSAEDLNQWGEKLSEATQDILQLHAQGTAVKDIALSMETRHGLPPEVTFKYIIALGTYQSQQNEQNQQKQTG